MPVINAVKLKPKRRRRRPDEAEAEILKATERFLWKHPFRDLNVLDLMDDTGLKRSSFYHYFDDRHELIVRLVDRLAEELTPFNEIWMRSGSDPISDLRTGYEGIGRFWVQHGPVLRAIADAARHDALVEKAHRAFRDRFVRFSAERIRADMERGLIPPLNPDATAEALIMMSEAVLNEKLGDGTIRDWQPVIDALATIWQRALYGTAK
jgi:TetR/AcrR family transcriptional regulator, ethionamide resistance regulator